MENTTQIVLLQQDYIYNNVKANGNFPICHVHLYSKSTFKNYFYSYHLCLHSVYECMFMNKKPKGFAAKSDLLLCQAS